MKHIYITTDMAHATTWIISDTAPGVLGKLFYLFLWQRL